MRTVWAVKFCDWCSGRQPFPSHTRGACGHTGAEFSKLVGRHGLCGRDVLDIVAKRFAYHALTVTTAIRAAEAAEFASTIAARLRALWVRICMLPWPSKVARVLVAAVVIRRFLGVSARCRFGRQGSSVHWSVPCPCDWWCKRARGWLLDLTEYTHKDVVFIAEDTFSTSSFPASSARSPCVRGRMLVTESAGSFIWASATVRRSIYEAVAVSPN